VSLLRLLLLAGVRHGSCMINIIINSWWLLLLGFGRQSNATASSIPRIDIDCRISCQLVTTGRFRFGCWSLSLG
jgi:hypothetical protein